MKTILTWCPWGPFCPLMISRENVFLLKTSRVTKRKRLVLIRSLVLKILIDFCFKWQHGALLLRPPLGGGILSHLETEGVFWGLCLLWPFPLPQSVSISFDFLTTATDSRPLSRSVYKERCFRTRMKVYICDVKKTWNIRLHNWHSDLVSALKSAFEILLFNPFEFYSILFQRKNWLSTTGVVIGRFGSMHQFQR